MEFFLGSSPVHEEVDEGRGCREDTDHHEAAGTDAPVGFEGRGLEEEEPLREREGRGEEEVAQQRRGEEEGDIQREEERTMLVEQVRYMCVCERIVINLIHFICFICLKNLLSCL